MYFTFPLDTFVGNTLRFLVVLKTLNLPMYKLFPKIHLLFELNLNFLWQIITGLQLFHCCSYYENALSESQNCRYHRQCELKESAVHPSLGGKYGSKLRQNCKLLVRPVIDTWLLQSYDDYLWPRFLLNLTLFIAPKPPEMGPSGLRNEKHGFLPGKVENN